MPAVPFAKTGTAPEDTAWSWDSTTQNALLGSDGSDWSKFKAAHAWWDGSTGDDAAKKAPYKLPHHRMGDSGLEAVWHGVSNAMARLSQASIPESEMKSVFDHLASHYAQWGKDAPEWNRFVSQVHERATTPRLALPMNTTRAMILATRPQGVPTDSDMPFINQQMRSPISNPERLYAFPAAISDQQIDSYYTRMTPLTLSNYAMGATAGVSVCDSHNHSQMPIGRSYFGTLGDDPAGGLQTQSLAYLIRGMQLPGGMRSDDYITALEGGIYHDVSVGFDPSRYWCTVCGCDMLSNYDCSHWPGRTYDTEDGPIQCIADVDATLVEYSPVYKGANPGAEVLPNGTNDGGTQGRGFVNIMVLKATAEVERGRASQKDLTFVEDRCHVRLFQRFSGYTPPQQTEGTRETVPTEKPLTGAEFVAGVIRRLEQKAQRAGKAVSAENMTSLQAIHGKMQSGHGTMADAMREMGDFIMSNGGVTADPDQDGDVDDGPQGSTDDPDNDTHDTGALNDSGENGTMPSAEQSTVSTDPLNDGVSGADNNNTTSGQYTGGRAPAEAQSRLTPQERDALNFAARMRSEAIDEALKSGARAHGDRFNEERYRMILARSDYDEIRGLKADWDEIAARALSPLGRQQANGVWTTEPTRRAERQTSPQNPNDPIGLGTLNGDTGAAKPGKVLSKLYKA